MYGAGRVNAAVDRALKANSPRRNIGRGSVAALALSGISAIQDALLTPAQLKVKNDNSISWDNRNKDFVDKPKASAATPQRTGTTSGRTGRGGTTADRNTSNTNATAGRYVPGSQQKSFAKPPAAKPKPPSRSSGSAGTGGGQTRSSGGSSAPAAPRSSAPRSTTPSTSSDAGMKNQDKNFRGNLFEKTFGYKRGEAPDQVKSKPSSFDTKSDTHTPTTKVDGSKLNAMKIDQKKVDEYKRRKDRYYN
jgi:hypothetical protein